MPLPQNTFYKISFSFFILPIYCILFSASCNSANKTDKAGKDNLIIFELPAPVPVPAAEAQRIKINCRLWYDSVLKIKGFNGGIIVAKDGNIVFEQYRGTGHLPKPLLPWLF